MTRIHIDIETQAVPDLTKVGAYKYFEHPDTRISQICFGIDADNVERWDNPRKKRMPSSLADALHARERTFVAHNASFERVGLNSHAGAAVGFPSTAIEDWECTLSRCSYAGLPKALDKAAEALDLSVRKDTDGKSVMLKLAKVRKPTEKDKNLFHEWELYPDDFEKQARYCVRDVEVERAIDHAVPMLPLIEQETYWLDQRINDRGVMVDIPFIEKVCSIIDAQYSVLQEEATRLCGVNASQVAKILEWANARGAAMSGFTKDDVAEALTRQLDPVVERVLRIRQSASKKTSGSKFMTARRSACSDGRVKGMFRYHFAAPGRWAGALIQLHNLPRAGYPADLIADVMDTTVSPFSFVGDDDQWG